MTVDAIIQQRVISEVLHFTTNRGLVGSLAKGMLLSRARLQEDDLLKYILHPNAKQRPEAEEFFDKSRNWLDYVNLSISEINARYFMVSQRWHTGADVWWCILSFDAEIMTHAGVCFATTNNSYDLCRRATGQDGLAALFAPVVPRKRPDWCAHRATRGKHLPTCEQAEVLYPEGVALDHLRRVYVRDDVTHDQARGSLDEFGFSSVEVVVSARKFQGMPN